MKTENNSSNLKHKFKSPGHSKGLITFVIPGAIWFVMFSYIPLFGILMAFKYYRYRPGKGFVYSLLTSKNVGFSNFNFLFRSPDLLNILRNTILYNVVFIILGATLPVCLAIMLTRLYSQLFAKVAQTTMFLPYFFSWTVVSYFLFAFLSTDKGLINKLLLSAGQDPVMWYQKPSLWPAILILVHTWKIVGYQTVIYLAAIYGIDSTLYENAIVDGASPFDQTWHITLPLLRPVIGMMILLNTAHILNTDFGLFYQVTRNSGQILSATQTLDVYVYKALMESAIYGYSTAVGFLQNSFGCAFLLIANWIIKKLNPESAVF